MNIEELVKLAKKFYADNGLDVPKSVTEYISVYPPGYSRQVLSKTFNLKCSEFVALLNPAYNKADPIKTLHENATRLSYSVQSNLDNYKTKDRVDLRCNDCGIINNTTLDSLRGSTLGCPNCKSHNMAWHKRPEQLKALLLDKFDAVLTSEIPKNQNGTLELIHNTCGTMYTTTLVGATFESSPLRGSCPNCRPTDRRVVFDGITFGSQFEHDSYKILKHLHPELHVKYSKFFPTTRQWVCDFKIDNYWIEVSNFKTDYKNYFANIEEKRCLVESHGAHFLFVTSIKELTELVTLL